jgi:hypothetical protein
MATGDQRAVVTRADLVARVAEAFLHHSNDWDSPEFSAMDVVDLVEANLHVFKRDQLTYNNGP